MTHSLAFLLDDGEPDAGALRAEPANDELIDAYSNAVVSVVDIVGA